MKSKKFLAQTLSIVIILVLTFVLTACSFTEKLDQPQQEEEKSELLQVLQPVTVNKEKADLPQSEITYPQVTGLSDQALEATINQILKNEALSYREKTLQDAKEQGFDIEKIAFYGDYEVTYNRGGLLSIAMPQGSYMLQAAHPSNYLSAVTVDVRTGNILSLSDLFIEKEDIKALLDPLMKKQIEERNLSLLTEFAGLEEDQDYYLGPSYLILYYQPYAYTPHAYGVLKFAIPYQAIAAEVEPKWGLLDRDSQGLTEEEVRALLLEAHRMYWYIARGGQGEGAFETFTQNGMEYRYLRGDIETRQGLEAYLGKLFTSTAIEQSLQNMGIVEKEGRMAQPNADGGSMLNWEKMGLYLIDEGEEKRVYEVKISHETTPEEDQQLWTVLQREQGTWKLIETVDSFM
ncbi:DL-endopeptidase inhibitor IseA family protein [Heliorestis convoluta]|uniref:DUF3298 domain-containing protein n=1 Tax=Heliorestis convoluta TaxID=356322 RepID=A0A5Q2N0E1_9FIRM|nr:DL-endopeptidase inhibitor IseA family protein [Heliorestis convoluta]QGG48397.1 hypothetical protein FTV88_2299 [Heliorestis convoluta]